MDKGALSNIISASLLVLGLVLGDSALGAIVLSTGMFAFSGGITNTLAVKMLFDRIPGLVGSGVIPARFKEIRREIKQLILAHFFSEEYLQSFVAENVQEIDWSAYLKPSSTARGPFADFVDGQWKNLTAPGVIRPVVKAQVDKLMDAPFGGLLAIVGSETIEDAIGKFVARFLGSMKPKVLEASATFRPEPGALGVELDEEKIIADLRAQVNHLLERKLQELDAERVKRLTEDVMRKHLGWLVVWGNIFGGLLGLAAYLLTGGWG